MDSIFKAQIRETMNRFFLPLFFIPFFPILLSGQMMESGDITAKMSGIINNLPGAGGDDYIEPTIMEMASWEAMLGDLLAGNYANTATAANALGYDLIEFLDDVTSETYYVLQTAVSSFNYWGTYVYNPNACRGELIIMSPHPKKDFNTGKQGIYCFQQNDALFFMVAGTDRCNSPDFSTCSGSTKVCSGSSENYRITDMAHVTEAIWQVTTEFMHDNVGGTYFAQLHGFTKLGSDPYVIMSNGTRNTPNPDKIVSLRDELLVVDNTLTFKIAHLDQNWDRLIGFTNTNGRYINSSANVCSSSAINTNGRFLHIEQEKSKLRDDITGWHKMANALGEAFPGSGCAAVAPLPVELAHFDVELKGEQAFITWQTLSELNHHYFEVQRSTDGHHFEGLTQVAGAGDRFTPKDYQWTDFPLPGHNYYRLKQVDYDGTTTYSNTQSVLLKTDWYMTHHLGGSVTIHFDEVVQGSVSLYNMMGQHLNTIRFEGDATSLPVRQNIPGLVFIQCRVGGRFKTWVVSP
jgi:hypothetical protein